MSDTKNNADTVGARMGCAVTLKKLEKTLPDKTKVRTHARYLWRATFIEGGERKQKYFKTKSEAEKWKEKREKEVIRYGTDSAFTPAERATVVETRGALAAAGITLREAVSFAVANREKENRSCTVSELVADAITTREKAGRSGDYISDMRIKLGRFAEKFGERPIATITAREIEIWLHGLGVAPGSVNSYRGILVVLFNDAIRHGFSAENPAEKAIRSKEVEGEVGILHPNEASALLIQSDDAIVPALSIGLLAGLRTAELTRLDWEDVRLDLGHVLVKAKNAKSAKNRIIPMSENLKHWLRPFARTSGPVWPKGGRRLAEVSRNNAGFGTPNEIEAARLKGEKLKEWPKNALRHSYATYHLAEHQNAAELALYMGHSNTNLIFAHYRKPVTKEDAEIYWNIRPDAADNVVEMTMSKAS